MKTVITGAKGWAGKSAISVLSKVFKKQPADYCLLGRTAETFSMDSVQYSILAWENSPKLDCSLLLPFAFPTADKVAQLGEETYRANCLDLIEKTTDFIKDNKPEKCLILSSGIVTNFSKPLVRNESFSIYKEMKIQEEIEVTKSCKESGTKLLVCRVFSVSGRFMMNPERYALGNFIVQGLRQKKIVVSSQQETWRRYLNFEDLIHILVLELLQQLDDVITLESGGTLVELEHLASEIAQQLDVKEISVPANRKQFPDKYYSSKNDIEERAAKHGVELQPIANQVSLMIDDLRDRYARK